WSHWPGDAKDKRGNVLCCSSQSVACLRTLPRRSPRLDAPPQRDARPESLADRFAEASMARRDGDTEEPNSSPNGAAIYAMCPSRCWINALARETSQRRFQKMTGCGTFLPL